MSEENKQEETVVNGDCGYNPKDEWSVKLYKVFAGQIDLMGFFKLNYDKWRTLIKCGVLSIDKSSAEVRKGNAGMSDYAKHVLQSWALWIEYSDLSAFTKDMLKRLLRTKSEPGKTMRQSRILDLEKIIHIANEELRQLKLEELYEKVDNEIENKKEQ